MAGLITELCLSVAILSGVLDRIAAFLHAVGLFREFIPLASSHPYSLT